MAAAEGGAAGRQHGAKRRARGHAISAIVRGRSAGPAGQPDCTVAGRDRGRGPAITAATRRNRRTPGPAARMGRSTASPSEIGDLRSQLEAGSQENEQLRQNAAVLASRVEAADEQVIAISHYLSPLIDEVSRLRCERDAISRERGLLAAQIAATPQARLRSLWRRLINRRQAAT